MIPDSNASFLRPTSPTSPVSGLTPDSAATLALKPQIVEAVSAVFDPEIPVNIYELGLIYDVIVDAKNVVGVKLTLTSPSCPAAQSIPNDVIAKVQAVPGVKDVRIEFVWEPPWSPDRMSEAAKLQLGLL